MMQRIGVAVVKKLHNIREQIIAFATFGLGAGLAFGLYSDLRALAISVAGVGVYVVTIVIDPLRGLVLWLVTQPLLERYLNISLGAGIPDLSLSRLCLALVSLFLLARTAVGYRRMRPFNRFDLLAFLWMVGMMQAGARGLYGINSMQSTFDLYCIPILVYFAVKNLVTSQQSVRLVLFAVLIVAVYSAIYAFYESTTGNVLFAPPASDKHAFRFYTDSGLRILRGIWQSNTNFGRVFVMAIPILFYFYLKAPSSFRKIFFAICLVLVLGGLYLTYKRAAWLAMIVVVVVMQFFYPQFRRLSIVLLIVAGAASVLNWDRISDSAVYTDRINSQYSTSEARTQGWEHALEFWSASPLVGHGFQQYRNLARAAGYRDQAIESEHLEILVSAGLAGFLPYVGMLLSMGYDGLQHYRGQVSGSLIDRDLVAVFWGVLVGYVVTLATSVISDLMISSLLLAVAGAVIYSRAPSLKGT